MVKERRPGRRTRAALPYLVIATVMLAASACHRTPLPEADTSAGHLYAQRCGQCHAPFDPRAMTSAMWEVQVAAMEVKIRAAGLKPLDGEQRQTILDYLARNAGSD